MKRSSLFRRTLVAFLALTILSLSAAAQTGSAPAKPTLTEEERKVAVAYLEETRKKFLDSLQGVSEAQWKFKSAPDRWSIAEVAEHIAISEETILGLITQQILKTPVAAPEKRESVKGKETMVRNLITNRSQKAQAPEMLKPINRWATQAELVKAFQASRDNTIKYVQTTQEDLRSHIAPHPAFKDLDAYQWLFLLSGHSERHTDQIKEVKADPNFPKK